MEQTNKRIKHHIVYKQVFAFELIARGHQMVGTMPNPARPDLLSYIFEIDDTFFADLDDLRKE